MKFLAWLTLGLLALPGWSEEVRVSLASDRPRYFLGENVLLQFRVENTGKTPLLVDIGGDYRGSPRSLRYQVKAFDQRGHLLEDPHPNPMCFGGLSCKWEIKPGKAFQASLALAHYRRIPGPGRYRIQVHHDLGWKDAPSASMEVEFQQPTPEQAAQVVQEMSRLPPAESVSMGQLQAPYRDFWTLSYPVYLQPLTSLANAEALQGLGQIPRPEALASLLKLAQRPELQREAARQICLRLPEANGASPSGAWEEERKRLCQRGWSRSYAGPVRELALSLIGQSEDCVSCGAYILTRLGLAQDAEAVLAVLDRYLPAVSSYPRPGGAGYELEQAVAALPGPPAGLTSSAAQLQALRHKKFSAPLLERALHDRSCRVRELAVQALRDPKAHASDLTRLLQDPDPGVQVAVCEKLPGDPALLGLLRSTPDEWVLRAAAQSCGQPLRWECARILAERLPERERWLVTYQTLAGQVMTRVRGNSSQGDPEPAELQELRHRWLDFLDQHKPEIEAGTTYAELPLELIPSNFSFSP